MTAAQNTLYTILVPAIVRSTTKAVAITGWRARESAELDEVIIWLPRRYRDERPLIVIQHNRHNTAIQAPAWLLMAKDIQCAANPTGSWKVCEVGAVTVDEGVPENILPRIRIDQIDAPLPDIRTMPRHEDAIWGDLNGVEELIREGDRRPETLARRDALRQEMAALMQLAAGVEAPMVPCGYEIDPDWEGPAPYYDGELEIAGDTWGVPYDHPNFWREVELRMIAHGDRRVCRPLPGVVDHRRANCRHAPGSWCGECDPESNRNGPTRHRPYGTWMLSRGGRP